MDLQAEIRRLLSKLQADVPAGFAIACHIRYTTPLYLFQTYAKDWIAHYNEKGLVMQDPIVSWSFQNTGTIRWSGLEATDPAGVLGAAKSYGMAYGFACGIERGDSRSMAGFARKDREFSDTEIAETVEMAENLHDLTANIPTLDSNTRDALRALSITFTHP